MELLSCRRGGFYVDGTVGGGGYAEAVIERSAPDGFLLGLDWDAEAIERARQRFHAHSQRVLWEQVGFDRLPEVLENRGLGQADGVVLDLGVSSFQLNDPDRGFSFLQDGPLDMRMNRGLSQTAADLVNALGEKELAQLIFQLGEEKWARRIAHAIVSQRKTKPFSSTLDLADLIKKTVPKTKDSRRIHPATRTFQALRLAVNQELDVLKRFLSHGLEVLKPGGRLCIVAFHSLEDRIVKEYFKDWAQKCRCPRSEPRCRCEGKPLAKILTKKVLRPSQEEMEKNPRSRSARLRAVEKCG